MNKIHINGRDELLVIDLAKVAYFKAEDDYTTVYFIGGVNFMLTINLAKVEAMVATVGRSEQCSYVRIGRSIIVNEAYVFRIEVLSQKIYFCNGTNMLQVSVPRDALKKYKQFVYNKLFLPTNQVVSQKIDGHGQNKAQ